MKQKLLNSLRLRVSLLVVLLCSLFVGHAWATPTTYNFSSIPTTGWSTSGGSQTINGKSWTYSSCTYIGNSSSKIQVGSKKNPQTTDWTISTAVSNFGSGKKITAISITAYTTATSATYDISAGGSSVKSGSLTTSSSNYSVSSLNVTSGDIVITLTGSSTSQAMYLSNISVTYDDASGGGSGPSISASDVNIAQDATNGSIAYTLANATGNVTAEVTDGDWLSLGTVTASEVPFTCSANTGAQRTATVTLSFTDAENKIVTVTQAAKTVDAPVFNLASSGYFLEGTELTLTSAGNTIYYNITTNGSDPAAPTSSSTEYTGPIALSSGIVKVKAIAYDDYGNYSTVASRTVNGVAPASLPFNWAGGLKSALTALTGVIGVGLGSDYTDSKYGDYKIKFDTDGDNILIFTNEQPVKVCVGALLNGSSTSSIKIQESANGSAFTDVQSFSVSGKQYDVTNIETTNAFTTTTRVIKILFVKSGSNIGIGPISINSIPVKVTAAGYTTYVSTHNVSFPDGVTGYIASAKSSENITLTPKESVPENTPVVLKATEGTYFLPIITTSPADVTGNLLLASDGSVTSDGANIFALGKKNGEVGFYLVSSGQTVPAGKAYLDMSGTSVKEFLGFSFDEDVDAISQIEDETMRSEAVYDLSGRRVQKPTKGLYIVNGKKYIKK